MNSPLHTAALALSPAIFTHLLPATLRYRRGPAARAALILSAVLTAVLLLFALEENARPAWAHPLLLSVFLVSAAIGLSICRVGLHDRKRSAWLALAALLFFAVGAVSDRLAWSSAASLACLALAWSQRHAAPANSPDEIDASTIAAHNRTRRARSIPRKLIREGQLHLLPVYYLATLSDLAREGILHSGSYRFADHIYRMQPSGRGPLGRWIDRKFLTLPASQAFHRRYKHAQHAARAALESFPVSEIPLRLLAVPCGLPRDVTELGATLARENPALLARLDYHGMDIDPELLQLADAFTRSTPVRTRHFHRGNALLRADYPSTSFHAIISTGLGEFLTDAELATFYRNVHASLLPGGTFYTSATAFEPRSETLLRAFELLTHYRSPEQLAAILTPLGWSRLTFTRDATGLQTFVTATK